MPLPRVYLVPALYPSQGVCGGTTDGLAEGHVIGLPLPGLRLGRPGPELLDALALRRDPE